MQKISKISSEDIEYRVKVFTRCLANSTKITENGLIEDYKTRLTNSYW